MSLLSCRPQVRVNSLLAVRRWLSDFIMMGGTASTVGLDDNPVASDTAALQLWESIFPATQWVRPKRNERSNSINQLHLRLIRRPALEPTLSAGVQPFHFGAFQSRHVLLDVITYARLKISQVPVACRKPAEQGLIQ